MPDVSGQSPPSTLNRLDLPEPLGPVTSKLVPAGTRSVRSFTRVASAGVTTIAFSKAISSLTATMLPWLRWSLASLPAQKHIPITHCNLVRLDLPKPWGL